MKIKSEWNVFSYIKAAAVSILVLVVIGYSFYQARQIIQKPTITIESPENGSTLSSPLIEVRGKTTRISRITFNDRQIFVDESGVFAEKTLLSPGYNVFKIAVEDSLKRKAEKLIEVVYKPGV